MSFDLPKILPPYDDMVFKSILTRPDAELARVDLLSVLLGKTVKTATVRNTELPAHDVDVKQERFDVSCWFDDGDQAAVEMQAEPMRGDTFASGHKNIRERAVFGLCDLHVNQTGSGKDYADFVKSFHITITNYRVFDEKHKLVEIFSFKNQSGIVLAKSVAAVFVDLTLVGKVLKKSVDEMTAEEMWAVFLSKANESKYSEIIEKILKKREGISVANEMLHTISQDEFERARFHSRKMALQDAEHNRVTTIKQWRSEILTALDNSGESPEFIDRVTEFLKKQKI